jgi:hypothetical protein
LSSTTTADQEGWKLLYPDDLLALGKELHSEFTDSLASVKKDEAVLRADPANPGTLSFVPSKGDMVDPRNEPGPHPGGARKGDTVVLFTPNNNNLGPRLLITLIHKLESKDLGSLLRVLDAVSAPLERKEGWAFGLDAKSELVETWKGLEGREVSVQKRAERMGHLLGYAWYGAEEDRPEFIDGQMWCWC